MSGLSDLQTAFKAHLLEGAGEIVARVQSTPGLAAEVRLDIYRNAYHARLEEALATDYEALRAVLGEEAFSTLSRDYIQAFPSTHFSLRWFGRKLADFLTVHPPYLARPDLAELARFEWTLAEAFDAADAPIAAEADAARIPPQAWPDLRVSLHPSLRRATCRWNTPARWRELKDHAPASAPVMLSEPAQVLVWRDGLTTRYRTLPGDEAAALAAAAQGAVFAELCEALVPWNVPEDVALRAAGLLKGWLAGALVTGLDWSSGPTG